MAIVVLEYIIESSFISVFDFDNNKIIIHKININQVRNMNSPIVILLNYAGLRLFTYIYNWEDTLD